MAVTVGITGAETGGGTKAGKGSAAGFGSSFLPKPGTRHAVFVGRFSNLETGVTSSLSVGGSGKKVGSI
jgi:hypothetical protein